jgi:hypothetical protein
VVAKIKHGQKILHILRKEGYRNIRNVPGVGWCGVMDMLFTVGVFCGLEQYGYRFRYCFSKELPAGTAEQELKKWN